MKKIAIYGAGGFGREVAWLAESCDNANEVVCFIDDEPNSIGKTVNDIPVYDFNGLQNRFPGITVMVAIGSPSVRQTVVDKLGRAGFPIGSLVHPRTEKSRWVKMEEGTIICAGCILTTNIHLKRHVQINLDCTIGHDVVMDDYTTLAPGVHVSGWVNFGKRVYVGTGAVFINGTVENPLVIGDDVVIGAGACVTKSISSGTWGGLRNPPQALASEPCPNTPPVAQIEQGPSIKTINSEGTSLKPLDRFSEWQYPEIEEGIPTKYNWVVQHRENFKLGYRTDIGAFSYINAKYGVVIEDYAQIGSHCSVYSMSTIDNKTGPVVLKKNCRIGSHSTIMPGVTVGENAVVGAHSFVNRDVPGNAVVVGVPAKRII